MNNPLVHLAVATTAVRHMKKCRIFVLVATSYEDRETLHTVLTRAGWRCYKSPAVPAHGVCAVFANGHLDETIAICSSKKGKYLIVGTQEPQTADVEYLYVDGLSSFPTEDSVRAAQGIINCETSPDDTAFFYQVFGGP